MTTGRIRLATEGAHWLLAACAAVLLLCLGGLAGCAPDAGEADVEANAAVGEEAEGHEAIALRVAAPVALQGVLEELADAYALDVDWLSFDVQVYESAKKQNKAITPTQVVVVNDDGGAADSVDAGSDDGEIADGDKLVMLPEADIVFENSPSAMDDAEELLAADPATRSDLIADGLAIAASSDAPFNSASTADIAAGSFPLAVVTGKGVYAKRQYEALSSIGVYEDGGFAGYYAENGEAVSEFDTAADLFAALAKDDSAVAIVRTSDLYRYGGVKVVGAVPSRMYAPMLYPLALGMNLSALENGEQVQEAAQAFLDWMATDEEALGIVEKWGFRFIA